MGVIFKYNDKLIQCQNLQKKLKKLKLSEDNIEIIKDNIPPEELEKEYCLLVNGKIKEKEPRIEKVYKQYYYTDGKDFTGVFKSDTRPEEISTTSWCLGWHLMEGTPEHLIKDFTQELQETFRKMWNEYK